MSAAKRSRGRPRETSPQPAQASKRLKTTISTHVPTKSGLAFLVDEDDRVGRKLDAKLTNGTPGPDAARVDESHAVVARNTAEDGVNGTLLDESDASSDSEEDSEDSSEEENIGEDGEGEQAQLNGNAHTNGRIPSDSESEPGQEVDNVSSTREITMADANAEQPASDEEDVADEPSFGDMLQARHPDPIDVQASFPNPFTDSRAMVPASGSRTLAAPSGTSLGTVLTQALKTNDKDLLESCLQSTDVPTIRSTIQRLQSQHVSTLLQRIAERIYKRPGRTGPLMVWIQWSLVAHGGYLAAQPEVMQKLKALNRVVQERASGLQTLLHLKGKLDMLSAQLELRRNMQAASRAANADDDDDEEGVVYVEGQPEDEWSDDEEAPVDNAGARVQDPSSSRSKNATANKPQMPTPRTDDSDSDEAAAAVPNGIAQDIESDESDDDDDDENEMLDIEAEEANSADSDDDDLEGDSDEEASSAPESEDDDDDDDSSEDDSDVAIQAPEPKTLQRKR